MTSSQFNTQQPDGPWSALRSRLFAVVLIANLAAQLAVFMNGLAGAWALTGLTESPAVVAALQVALTLPGFLLAFFAGALADVASRKRIIVTSLVGSVVVTGMFTVGSITDSHTTASILGLTALLGVLSALAAPAWIAVIPDLVPRHELPGAMTLSSAGMSLAMALGPAIAGFVIGAAGPTWVFGLNVAVLLSATVALTAWKPEPRSGLPAEHLGSAIRVAVQYVRHDRPLKMVIAKVVPFALTATALGALLPALARFQLGVGPSAFGALAGAAGIGAVAALLLMPSVRRRFGPDTIVVIAMLVEAVSIAAVASTSSPSLAFVMLLITGAATLAVVSTVMTVLQVVLPSWVRGRGVSIYMVAVLGSFAFGSMVWGAVAEAAGVQTALVAAAGAMAVGAVVTLGIRLDGYLGIDTNFSQVMDDPPAVTSVHDDDGPILVTARWKIDPDEVTEFVVAMDPVRRTLRRQGALSFSLAEDVENEGVMLESFTLATWSEYKRLPGRSTVADVEIHEALLAASGDDAATLTAHRVIDVRSARKRTQTEEAAVAAGKRGKP